MSANCRSNRGNKHIQRNDHDNQRHGFGLELGLLSGYIAMSSGVIGLFNNPHNHRCNYLLIGGAGLMLSSIGYSVWQSVAHD